MDKDLLIVEFMKIYYSCHPGELPKDPAEAFKLMSDLHKKYKTGFIDNFKSKSGKFVDKFLDEKEDGYL